LKRMTVGGIPTKVIAVGIERQVNETELNNIVSTPVDRNVILIDNFTGVSEVERRLIDAIGISCVGQWSSEIHNQSRLFKATDSIAIGVVLKLLRFDLSGAVSTNVNQCLQKLTESYLNWIAPPKDIRQILIQFIARWWGTASGEKIDSFTGHNWHWS